MWDNFWGVPSEMWALVFLALGVWAALEHTLIEGYAPTFGIMAISFGILLTAGSIHAIGGWVFAWLLAGLGIGIALHIRVTRRSRLPNLNIRALLGKR